MNERIQELARQAFINAGYDTEDELFDILFEQGTEFHEKFAELIVKECLYQVADVRIENDFEPVSDAALIQALTGIRKYFGVEE